MVNNINKQILRDLFKKSKPLYQIYSFQTSKRTSVFSRDGQLYLDPMGLLSRDTNPKTWD